MIPLHAKPAHSAPALLQHGWRFALLAIVVMVALPLVFIFSSWNQVNAEIWAHLLSTTLWDMVGNTLVLAVGVAVLASCLGLSLAWLTACCEFPGRRHLDWALMLPLAIPAYVQAFVIVGLCDYSGPLQTALRAVWPDAYLPVRNRGGAIVALSLVLYPYVYMLARTAFLAQGRDMIEAARSLGLRPREAFFRVALPLARPALVAGSALVIMETLADFGAVSVFNVDTFTTGIYKAWYGFFDLHTAAQLATFLLLFAISALFLERYGRGKQRYFQGRRHRRFRSRLRGRRALMASLFASSVVTVAFVVPVVQLAIWATEALGDLSGRYINLILNTLSLGAIAALIAVLVSLVLAYAPRLYPDRWIPVAVQASIMGYAIPGTLLAVGVFLSLNWLDGLLASISGVSGQWLVGSVAALIVAYVARFLAVSYHPIDTSLQRIRPALAEAAHLLGANRWQTLQRIYLPMLRSGVFTAALLVMVDVMKEMPATLLMRPFGWDTLAVRIYEMTSEGEWERAALPGLTLVIVGLLPVIILIKRSR